MSSIFEEIKSFFSGPSIEKCSKEEKKENDKHDIKVKEEIERHKSALIKIRETASCKLKPTNTDDTKPIIESQKVADVNDIGLEFPSKQEPLKQAFENQEPPKQEQEQKQEFRGGRKRRTRRPRKRSGKNTKRSH